MVPNLVGSSVTTTELIERREEKVEKAKDQDYKLQIVWRNVLIFFLLHAAASYACYLTYTRWNWKTFVYSYSFGLASGVGVTAGAHRLWAHRTYEAKLPLRILLMLFQTSAIQNDIYEWSRDHRVHHKFTDTNADPHNSKRGFFFSHIGWLMVRKHKDVFIKGKTIDLSDLEADPVVMFQKKYYKLLVIIFAVLIPPLIPRYCWNECWVNCIFGSDVLRYILSLHYAWSVNSAAHMFGTKPYDKNINPTENRFVSFVACGEGWHNYHHAFPWDYKAAELGNYRLNYTTAIIDLMAKIGWAYNMKTVSPELVKKRAERTGDGSWQATKQKKPNGDQFDDILWGWGDKDMKEEDVKIIESYDNKKLR